jgi:hypothetical protein
MSRAARPKQTSEDKKSIVSIGGLNFDPSSMQMATDPLNFWSPQNIERYLLIEPQFTSQPKNPYGPFKS